MISVAVVVHTVTDRPAEVEVEPESDGYVVLRLTAGDTRLSFYGLEDQLIELFNGCTDRIVDVQCRRKRERPELDFDAEFGLCMNPCEHPSVNGTTCAACGETVPF